MRRSSPLRVFGAATRIAFVATLAVAAAVGCSAKRGESQAVASNEPGASLGAGSPISVTSTDFLAGQPIPPQFTCAGGSASPELSWTPGPPETLSYAVVLTDLANSYIHWVIWDISPVTYALPAAVAGDAMPATPAGARQVHLTLAGPGNGYVGPCPNGVVHDYQFQVHALNVAMLSGVSTSSTPEDVRAQVLARSIAHGVLIGSSNAKKPGDGGAP